MHFFNTQMLRPISAAATKAPKSAITSKSTTTPGHINNLSNDTTAVADSSVSKENVDDDVDGVDVELGSDDSDNELYL